MKNLHQIRCYGKRYEPSSFEKKGWRGWWIRTLNWLRFSIERRVVYHVLVLQAGRLGDLADLNAVIESFESDVKTSRQRFTQPLPKFDPPSTGSVEGHLKELRKSKSVESIRETTERMMQIYASDPRQRRYGLGRGSRMMMEAETIHEVTNAKTDESAQSGGRSEVAGQAFKSGRVRPIHPEYSATFFNDEDGVEESDADVAESATARDRLRANTSAAQAATEHQRRVLSKDFSPGPHPSPVAYRGADAAGEGRPRSTGQQPEEHSEAPDGPSDDDDAGTEARTESTDRTA